MVRRFSLTLFFLFAFLQLWSNPVSADKAREKAYRFLNAREAGRVRGAPSASKALELAETGKDDSYYIYNVVDGGGFVVVSGEDATEEILGYSDTSSINPKSMPCNMRMLFNMYVEQIRYLRENRISSQVNTRSNEAELEAFQLDEGRLAKFGQDEPYNEKLKKYTSLIATGCGATALSQLLFYHQWPNSTSHVIPEYLSETKGFKIDAIPANTTIDWNHIIPQYVFYDSDDNLIKTKGTKDEQNAIQDLMVMAGASVYTNYADGVTGSSSSDMHAVPFALKHYFNYDESVELYIAGKDNEEWTEMLRKELRENGPVIVSGVDESAVNSDDGENHAFLLEGYDEEGRFNINFGWDGRGNNFFFLNTVKGLFTFTCDQMAIINAKPNKSSISSAPFRLTTKKFTSEGRVYSRSSSDEDFKNIQIKATLYSLIPQIQDFEYGIVFTQNGQRIGEVIPIGTKDGWIFNTKEDVAFEFSCGKDLPDGIYQIKTVSRVKGSSEWIDNEFSGYLSLMVILQENKLFIQSDESSQLRVIKFDPASDAPLRVGKESEYKLSILNQDVSPEKYDGGIIVVSYWPNGDGKEIATIVCMSTVNCSGNEAVNNPVSITFTPQVPGEQELAIWDKGRNEIGRLAINVLDMNEMLDKLEVTKLSIESGDVSSRIIDGTFVKGTLTILNSDEVVNKRFVNVKLNDTDTQESVTQPIWVNIDPSKSVSYRFSFSNLTAGHHYVITANYDQGDMFYQSEELLCSTDGTGETFPGNEKIVSYEYWFDDDIANKKSANWNGSDAMVSASIDTKGLEPGHHLFNFRVKRADNRYSAVNTTSFVKFDQGSSNALEYWLDEDTDNSQTIPLPSIGENCDLTLNLTDSKKFPVGYHKLNLRVTTAGGGISAVNSSGVFKIPAGKTSYLEYWLDGQIENKRVVEGKTLEDGYDFTASLDFGSVAPGAHRLYARAVSSDRKKVSAATMTPVIVKSLYADIGNAEAANVAGYSINVDGQQMVGRSFSDPRRELEMTHVLDTRSLTDGSHTLTAKFWNTASAASYVVQKFNVTTPEVPALTLSAEENDGLVNLQFQPVPNDLRYRIIRTDANGAKAKVDSKEGSCYPDAVTFIDNPPIGLYTYIVQTVYTDYDGTQHSLNSNEVQVEITDPQTEESAKDFGYIVGSILCDKNAPMSTTRVKFSGDDSFVADAQTGRFFRSKVPTGQSLTITVEGDNTHDYESKTITVKPGRNLVIIKGTLKPEFRSNNLENDLGMSAALELTVEDERHYATFSVKNLSTTNDWEGTVRVKVISKKEADGMTEDFASMGYKTKNLYIGESSVGRIASNESKKVKICIKDFTPRKDADYYLYFESEGKWVDSQSAVKIKSIGINSSCNMAENPVVRTIGKAGGENPQWDDDARFRFTALIVGLSSLIPGVDGNVGDLSPFNAEALALAKKVSGKSTAQEAIEGIFDILAGKTALEVINEPSIVNSISVFIHTFYSVCKFSKVFLMQKYWNDVLYSSYNYGAAQLVISNLALLAHATVNDDPIEASVASASVFYSLIYPASSTGAIPYAAMMYSYMVVGRSLVAKLMEYKKIIYDAYLPERLKANQPFKGDKTGDYANRQNTAIDMKLVIKNGRETVDFTQLNAQQQIGDIILWAHNNPAYEASSFHFTPVFMKDGIMLRCNGSKRADLLSRSYELDQLSLEVNFSSGRQIFIPLNEECDGVKFDLGNATNADDSFEKYDPATYTITLTTATGTERMSEELYLGKNKNRK